jgi:hypothetical protein
MEKNIIIKVALKINEGIITKIDIKERFIKDFII